MTTSNNNVDTLETKNSGLCGTKHKLRTGSIIVLITALMVAMYLGRSNVFSAVITHVSVDNFSPLPKTMVKSSRPNILLIVADDLGFNDIGYHGSRIKTPVLDELARTGVKLENYYVQPICTPTRGQLLSGRYEIHTGLFWILWPPCPSGLSLDSPTIADKLKEAGYATHMVGKWHVGYYKKEYLPTNRGFDSFFGLLNGHADYYNHRIGHRFMHGFDLMENNRTADVAKYKGNYSTILFAEKAKTIIRNHNPEKPLFLYLPFQAPHTPLQAPEKYLQMYPSKKTSTISKRKKVSAMVTCMDEVTGEIIEVMKEKGLWDNTVLIFTTDNGGEQNKGGSNWPLRGNKGQVFEGGIRAVGFVHSKLLDNRTTGTVSKELMHVTDWFPTLVNLAGGNLNGTKPLDGYDQWNTIKYGAQSPRKEILHYISPRAAFQNETFNTSHLAAIRIGDWKLVTGWGGHNKKENRTVDTARIWLFNVNKHPKENKDYSLEMPEKVESMRKRIEHYRTGMVKAVYPSHDNYADPKYHNGFWVPWR